MKDEYLLAKSTKYPYKWVVFTPTKKVWFGHSDYEDYTIHKDKARYERYLQRHKSREKWGKTGINTAGFWSRWLLWNKPSLSASIKDIEKRFSIKIKKLSR